jgi:hypothetical protein
VLAWLCAGAAWAASAHWLWRSYAVLIPQVVPPGDAPIPTLDGGRLDGHWPAAWLMTLVALYPVAMAIVLLCGSPIEPWKSVPWLEAVVYPYFKKVWFAVLAAAVAAVFLPERWLSVPLLLALGATVAALENFILIVLMSTVDPDTSSLELSMGWKIPWAVVGACTLIPVAGFLLFFLPFLQILLVTRFDAGLRTALETRRLMLEFHTALLTILLPLWLSFRKGRGMALGFLAWNLPFLAIPEGWGFRGGGGSSGGAGASGALDA